MKSGKITIKAGIPIFVHLCESEVELKKFVSERHPSVREDLNMIPKTMHPAGLTIGVGKYIYVYICSNLREKEFKETITHEALHVTNCVLRQQIYGTMDKEKLLIISDSCNLTVPGIEALKLTVQGVDEEDQAALNAEIHYLITSAIRSLGDVYGKAQNSA